MPIGDDIELILSIERIFKIYMLKTIVENLKDIKKIFFKKTKLSYKFIRINLKLPKYPKYPKLITIILII